MKPTRAQINKVLEEPLMLPAKKGPVKVLTDEMFVKHLKERIREAGSAAKLARKLNIDRRYISKALDGIIQPQLASALGYGSQLLRIWVKTKLK